MANVLTPAQEQFSGALSRLTGLDKNVIRGWTLAEESSGAAQQRVAQGNHNWLNIGYFDSGAGGLTKNRDWSSPLSAAAATAAFLKGQKYGASPSIQGILGYAGKSPAEQIAAIAKSGWASSGYGQGANLRKTYSLVSGLPAPAGGVAPVSPTPDTGTTSRVSFGKAISAKSGPELALAILNTKAPAAAKITYDAGMKPIGQVTVKADASVASGGVSPNAPGVIAEAKKFLGTPYKWGGTTPKGFDCSGFLQYVWGQKGVNIPRTTYEQVKAGHEVSISGLQPGDAVFFGSHDAPHHVGMYIGHGQFIQAPHTGDVVKISNLNDYLSSFAQARRFA